MEKLYIYIIPAVILWLATIIYVAMDARRRGSSVIVWILMTAFLWIFPFLLFQFSKFIGKYLVWLPMPIGLQLIDRYIYREIIKMTLVTVLGIAFIILANNIYNSADMFAQKKMQKSESVDIKTIALVNLLDTPASVVLAFPVASLIGVMLALGILGQGGEITAVRTGGVSLRRLLLPVILLSFAFSWMTYYMSQSIVPWCGEKSTDLKMKALVGKEADIERHVLFKYHGRVIYATRFNTKTMDLTKITVMDTDENGLDRFWVAFAGVFKKDKLILHNVKHYVCDKNAQLQRYQIIPKVTMPFPKELQMVHEKKRDSFSLAAGDLATKIARLEQSGINTTAEKIDQQFQISVPLACTIFSFVGFIFSIYNPRKEATAGVLYAILIAFIYYVFMAVIKSLAKQDQEILQNPFIAAWLTNIVFLGFGVFLFAKVRK